MLDLAVDLWVMSFVVTATLFVGVVAVQAVTRRVRLALRRERRLTVTVLAPSGVERRRLAA